MQRFTMNIGGGFNRINPFGGRNPRNIQIDKEGLHGRIQHIISTAHSEGTKWRLGIQGFNFWGKILCNIGCWLEAAFHGSSHGSTTISQVVHMRTHNYGLLRLNSIGTTLAGKWIWRGRADMAMQ